MPKPMTIYRPAVEKKEKHSFVESRRGKAYAEYGDIKTYSNKTQADKKVTELIELGFKCYRSFDWPYLIILE